MTESLGQIHAFIEQLNEEPTSASAQGAPPALWAVHLARAALTWGADSLDIVTQSGFIWVTMSKIPDLGTVYQDFQAGGQELLHQAVEAAQAVSQSLVLFFVLASDQTHRVEVVADSVQADPQHTAPLCLVVRLRPSAQLSYSLHEELSERLRFSPLPIFCGGVSLNQPLLHLCRHFPQAVRDDDDAGLRRNYVERIWLSDAPLQDLMMVADPLAFSAHGRLYQGRLHQGAPGTTNLQEWAVPKETALAHLLGSPVSGGNSLTWRANPPARHEYIDSSSSGGWLSALFGSAPKRSMAVGLGAVLRWGRSRRGPGLLFLIHRGILLSPLALGPGFDGCWAFVTTPRGGTHNDASLAMLDWTRSQFADMGQVLGALIKQGLGEELGIRFNFASEVKAAQAGFKDWASQQWGNPQDDY